MNLPLRVHRVGEFQYRYVLTPLPLPFHQYWYTVPRLSRIQTRTVESVRTVRVKEDRPWGAEQNSDNTAVQVLEFRSPVVVPPVLNSYSEAFIDRRQIFDPETGQYQNSPESTALVIWGACRIRTRMREKSLCCSPYRGLGVLNYNNNRCTLL